MIGTKKGVKRGCGTREEGAAYLETGIDEDGEPVWSFLIDSPKQFVPDSKIGQEVVRIHGTYHLIDWIGQTHYPYVSDFVEEVRRYGVSRRISRNLNVSLLTPQSRVLCVHARAVIPGTPEQDPLDAESERRCALQWAEGDTDHLDHPQKACTRKWYWDAEGQAPNEEYPEDEAQSDYRFFASFAYGPVEGLDVPEPKPGIFASFPITNLTVIEAEDGSHEPLYEDLSEASGEIPVIVSPA